MLNISICFFSNKQKTTCSPGDSCSRILSNSLKWPDSTRRSACQGELTEGSHDGCAQRDRACSLVQDEGGAHSSGLPSTIHTCLPGNQKMGGKVDGKFLWYIWYVLNLKQKVMVVIQANILTGWHGLWPSSIYYIILSYMVAKYGRSAEVRSPTKDYKQRLVVDAKGIYILQYSMMMMMLQMPELPFTSAQFVPTSQSHMNVVRAHTSSPIPRRAKIRPGVPTWARWPIIDSCMAIAMIQY